MRWDNTFISLGSSVTHSSSSTLPNIFDEYILSFEKTLPMTTIIVSSFAAIDLYILEIITIYILL